MNLNVNDTTNQNPINNGQSITPMQFATPWNQVKNYSNHSTGATQSGAASANPSSGGASGSPSFMWIALALGAYLFLR